MDIDDDDDIDSRLVNVLFDCVELLVTGRAFVTAVKND